MTGHWIVPRPWSYLILLAMPPGLLLCLILLAMCMYTHWQVVWDGTDIEGVQLDVRLRMPSWLLAPLPVHVNGAVYATGTPGSYLAIDRVWSVFVCGKGFVCHTGSVVVSSVGCSSGICCERMVWRCTIQRLYLLCMDMQMCTYVSPQGCLRSTHVVGRVKYVTAIAKGTLRVPVSHCAMCTSNKGRHSSTT